MVQTGQTAPSAWSTCFLNANVDGSCVLFSYSKGVILHPSFHNCRVNFFGHGLTLLVKWGEKYSPLLIPEDVFQAMVIIRLKWYIMINEIIIGNFPFMAMGAFC